MRDNPYKDLPPLERRPDGSLYRMTPAQRKQAASLIRRECCCCEDGNCIVLDDGDACTRSAATSAWATSGCSIPGRPRPRMRT